MARLRGSRDPAWRALLCGALLGLVVSAAPAASAHGLVDQLAKALHKSKALQAPGERLGFAAPTEPGPMTLDQAVATVRALHPKGEIVGAETQHAGRGDVHVVKVLRANGKIKVFRFDAATGAQLD